LGAGDRQTARLTEKRFCSWLDHVSADAEAIYLVGDIFDFWFEYRRVVPKGFTRTLGKLSELSDRGVGIHLFTGNHDMWCRDYLQEECGIHLHLHPEEITLAGQRLFIAHGDNMNIKGQPMLRLMNAGFRSTTVRALFSWLVHPDLALKFGKWWSGKSRKSHGSQPIDVSHLDFLIEYARTRKSERTEIDAFIFGHMHLPHDYDRDGLRVLFMSDWSGEQASYIALDDSGQLSIKTFDLR
ncbi:MAG: UDP-2,3-diacylglucosamine diphosphatase, partial [Alistipes sp.]|nr:UDP-2,3-diacylglucosamine diphosphatase [Alistipes sp.]